MAQRIVIITAWAATHRIPFAARVLAIMENRGFGTYGSI